MSKVSTHIEILDGISAVFVYIPKENFSTQNKEVQHLLKSPHRVYDEGKTVVVKTNLEVASDTDVSELKISSDFDEHMKSQLASFSCRCGCTQVQNTSVLRLPSDGWEELVDMWSCHNREFSYLLDVSLSPRKGGILYNFLYLVVASSRAPKCMLSSSAREKTDNGTPDSIPTTKIFYNELCSSLSEEYLVFHYLHEQFQIHRTVEIRTDSVYTLRLLGMSYLYKGSFYYMPSTPEVTLALKIGFSCAPCTKDTSRPSGSINAYFSGVIVSLLKKNSTCIFLGTDEISFVLQN